MGGRDVYATEHGNMKVMVNQTKVEIWNEGKIIGKKDNWLSLHTVKSHDILSLLYE